MFSNLGIAYAPVSKRDLKGTPNFKIVGQIGSLFTIIVPHRCVGTVGQERPYDVGTALHSSRLKRRPPASLCGVDLGAAIEQQLDDFEAAVRCGAVERSNPIEAVARHCISVRVGIKEAAGGLAVDRPHFVPQPIQAASRAWTEAGQPRPLLLL